MPRPRTRGFATLALALAGLAACGGDAPPPAPAAPSAAPTPTPERKPSPPFADAAPEEPRRYDVAGEYGGEIRIPVAGNPKTFNPVLANEASSTDIHVVLHRTLVDYDRDRQEIVPDLVSSYAPSPDHRTWTFTLRRGLRWSDGHPLTADDVAFAFEVVADEAIPNPIRSGLLDEKGRLPRLEKVDDLTVRFVLAEPGVHFWLSAGSLPPLPRHRLEEIYRAGRFLTDAWSTATPPADIVSAGPFRIREFLADERVVLERNPHYHGIDRDGRRLPYLDRVTFVVSPSFDTSMLKFMNGEVDLLDPVFAKDYPTLKAAETKGGYVVRDVGQDYASNFWWVNQVDRKDDRGKPYVDPARSRWFRDRRFRQALAHATDREGMVRTILFGLGEPLWNAVTPANRKWHNASVARHEFDLARAAAILDELGFRDRDGDGVREDPDGKPFSMVLNTNASNTDRVRVATILVDDLGKIGIRAASEPLDFNAMLERFRTTHDYDAGIMGISSSVPPHPTLMLNTFHSSGLTHLWNPSQPRPSTPWEERIDELLARFARTADEAEQKQLFDEVQAIVAEEVPWITTFVRRGFSAARTRVRNLRPVALRPGAHWNAEELWVE